MHAEAATAWLHGALLDQTIDSPRSTTRPAKVTRTHAGIEWVAANHVKPAIVTLSLGLPEGLWSAALDAAVQSFMLNHGVRRCNGHSHSKMTGGESGHAFIRRRRAKSSCMC